MLAQRFVSLEDFAYRSMDELPLRPFFRQLMERVAQPVADGLARLAHANIGACGDRWRSRLGNEVEHQRHSAAG